MSNISSIKVLAPAAAVVAALMLGGCASMTTYGTGKTAAAQTMQDITGILSLGGGKDDQAPIDYSQRAPIVEPPVAAGLPTPGSAGTAALASNWPTDPDEELKRQKDVIDELLAAGETPKFSLPAGTEPVSTARIRRVHHDDMTLTEKFLRGSGNTEEQKKLFADAKLAESGSFDQDGNPIRRYLTEPPVVYLEPDPTSPVVITEKPKTGKFNWPDLWPF